MQLVDSKVVRPHRKGKNASMCWSVLAHFYRHLLLTIQYFSCLTFVSCLTHYRSDNQSHLRILEMIMYMEINAQLCWRPTLIRFETVFYMDHACLSHTALFIV